MRDDEIPQLSVRFGFEERGFHHSCDVQEFFLRSFDFPCGVQWTDGVKSIMREDKKV